MSRYWRRLRAGAIPHPISPTTVEHYWRWPIRLRWRWMLGVSWHGVRDGRVRGLGPFYPAVRSFLWLGPLGIEFGAGRQRIEDWLWRRRLHDAESKP